MLIILCCCILQSHATWNVYCPIGKYKSKKLRYLKTLLNNAKPLLFFICESFGGFEYIKNALKI